MSKLDPEKLTRHQLMMIAVEAEADPRTVAAYLKGEKVRDLSKKRIEEAIKKLGSKVKA